MRPELPRGGDPRRVRALLDLDRTEAAATEAQKILARDPHHAEGLELLGLCRIRQGQPAEARKLLAEALAKVPERAHLHYLMGFAAGQQDDLLAAETALREAVRLEPEEPVYLRALAEHYSDRRRHADAIPLAERAIAVDPERAANHRTLGYCTSAAGQPQVAREAYGRAVRLDPHDAVAWNNLGCVLLTLGDRLEARAHFREALRLDPRGERARKNLALVAPARRPPTIYRDVEAMLGEALRELYDAGRLPPSLKTAALAMSIGKPAISHALTGRLRSRGAGGRLAAAVGTMAATMVVRQLRPSTLPAMGLSAALAGVGYFATAHRVTPLRRHFVEVIAQARREWEATRQQWLDGKLSRGAREAQVERQIERLALLLDADPPPPPSVPAPPSPEPPSADARDGEAPAVVDADLDAGPDEHPASDAHSPADPKEDERDGRPG